MDDVVNKFARELADAISAAVTEHPDIEACRERARVAGYEMKVTLEAVVGFVVRGDAQRVLAKDAIGKAALIKTQTTGPRKPPQLTVNDRRFLKSLRIEQDITVSGDSTHDATP